MDHNRESWESRDDHIVLQNGRYDYDSTGPRSLMEIIITKTTINIIVPTLLS